jgi:micrococcal nuclease
MMRKFSNQLAPVMLAIAGVACLGFQAWRRFQTNPSNNAPTVRRAALTPVPGQSKPGKVVSVQDGDSLIVLVDGREVKVRLCGIDAPELGQPLGEQAKVHLQQLVEWASKQVLIVPIKTTAKLEQTVAEVFTPAQSAQNSEENKLLNYEMVAAGMAYLYPQFAQDCPNREAIARAETEAKQQRQGIWATLNPSKPWDYRRQQFVHQVAKNFAQLNSLPSLSRNDWKNYLSDDIKPTLLASATWYGPYLNGRLTANGETFDQKALTAAHPSLPFNTHLKVTNLRNGKSVIVRVNDRQPPSDHATLDLSKAAAEKLGAVQDGLVLVEIEVVDPKTSLFEGQ